MDSSAPLDALLADRYVIERELGRGGMATVYLAHDRKHDRRVAIKVLHADLAAALGPERFLQEIRVTANLQHPHILGLIDSGLFGAEAGDLVGRPYYVMPYVDGESLRQRLDREQQLPVAESVRLATEVAGALDYAHRQGVIHRDIKPENILLHDGQALVADFGIALAVQQAGTQRMTQTGLSLGTPQYMSPEQAMGEKAISARSDIYALGAVTYEMLAGEPPFTGPTVQAIVARLMSEPPRSLVAQRHSIPEHVEAAVLQALEKVPADRFASAAEFAAALTMPGTTTRVRATHGTAQRGPTSRMVVALPWLVAAGAAAVATWSFARAPRALAAPSVHAMLPVGDSAGIGTFRILPGDSLMLVTSSASGPMSLIHLASGEAVALRGTENARNPSVSADGRSVAFTAKGQLWRMDLPDGAPTPLAPVKGSICTAWGTDGSIAVCEDEGRNVTRVPASGGTKDSLHSARGEIKVRGLAPLPGGRFLAPAPSGMILLTRGSIQYLGKDGPVDSLTRENEQGVPAGSWVQLLPSGHLAWITVDRRLVVAPIDPRSGRLTGPAVTLADSVVSAHFGTRGLLALVRGGSGREGVIVMAARSGKRDTLPYPLAEYRTFDVSPDGRRVAVVVATDDATDLRVLDVARAASRVLPVRIPREPLWTVDGRRLAVSSGLSHVVLLDPDDPRRIDTLFKGSFIPSAWTPDGKELAGSSVASSEYGVLMRFRPGVDSVPRRVATANGSEFYQSFSRDGRWYVFQSAGVRPEQSGVYVAENRDGAVPSQIAEGRFADPAWSADGREIIVLDRVTRSIAAIPVRTGPRPEFGQPVTLFSADRFVEVAGIDLHVLRDGRIAFLEGPPRKPLRAISLLTNWRAEYERRAGARTAP